MGASHPIPRVSSSSQSHAAFEGNKGSQHCSGLQPHTRSLPAAPHAACSPTRCLPPPQARAPASPPQLRAPPGEEEGLTHVKGQGSTVPTEQQGGGELRRPRGRSEQAVGGTLPAAARPEQPRSR